MLFRDGNSQMKIYLDFADLGYRCGSCFVHESSIWFGNECHIFGATYLTRSQVASSTRLCHGSHGSTSSPVETQCVRECKGRRCVGGCAGLNDWLGVSGARRPFASARLGIVDTPLQGFYENAGGIELILGAHGTAMASGWGWLDWQVMFGSLKCC